MNSKNLANISIAISFLGIIIFVLSLLINFGAIVIDKREVREEEQGCEIVDGITHINRGQCLPKDFVPEDLVPLSPRANWLNTKQHLTLKAKVMVEQLIEDAEKDGMCLVVTSGYRSYEEQEKLFNGTPEDRRDYVAPAGSSEHQTGLAVDFAACPINEDGERDDKVSREELTKDFEELPEYGWLLRNAGDYGFNLSFTEHNIERTGFPPENWHWMFIND